MGNIRRVVNCNDINEIDPSYFDCYVWYGLLLFGMWGLDPTLVEISKFGNENLVLYIYMNSEEIYTQIYVHLLPHLAYHNFKISISSSLAFLLVILKYTI